MMEWIQANAVLVGAVAVLLVLALLFLLRRGKALPEKREYRDVLSEGAAPAARNSALIDAPPAAAIEPPPVLAEGPPPAADEGDDLTRIKGLGPKISTALRALGVTRYAEIAAWTDEDVARIDAQLGAFAGRATRDNWIEQAKLLSSGDTAAYEAKFGKL
jgi:predicted flap endonuclease-1-like 5' DNA nuclease